jgi:hypothetical protein
VKAQQNGKRFTSKIYKKRQLFPMYIAYNSVRIITELIILLFLYRPGQDHRDPGV